MVVRLAPLWALLAALPSLAFADDAPGPAAPLGDLRLLDDQAPLLGKLDSGGGKRGDRFSISPLGLIVGLASFTYEHALSDRFSLTLSPSVLLWVFGGSDIIGGALGFGGAAYLTGNAPEGLRLSLDVTPGGASINGTDDPALFLSGRAMLGYQWVWDIGLSIGLSGGVQYVYLDASQAEVSFHGLLPAIDLNIGFVF